MMAMSDGVCGYCRKLFGPDSLTPVYNDALCRKCQRRLANARQIAFAIDGLILFAAYLGLTVLLGFLGVVEFLLVSVSALVVVFGFKDGFSGYSPGKFAYELRVVDRVTGKPIGWLRSAVRNLPISLLLLGSAWSGVIGQYLRFPYQVQWLLPIVAPVGLLALSQQLIKGYRYGDGMARTMVRMRRLAQSVGRFCAHCGYDLTGNLYGACPECGKPLPASPCKEYCWGRTPLQQR